MYALIFDAIQGFTALQCTDLEDINKARSTTNQNDLVYKTKKLFVA